MDIKPGNIVTVKRKPSFCNDASIVSRTIKSVNPENKTFVCDDAIRYKFSDIRYVAASGRTYRSIGDLDVETWDKMSPLDRMKHLKLITEK
jgi:hypothetical protein